MTYLDGSKGGGPRNILNWPKSNLLQPTKNATLWLFGRFWAWEPLAWLVGTICIGLGFLLPEERMYGTSRAFIIAGALLFLARIVHDSITKKMLAKDIAALILISTLILGTCAYFAFVYVNYVEWKKEVLIKMTFKSSPLFTEKRKRKIIWAMNQYYLYLSSLGFDIPTELPPLGLSPPHGTGLAGGSPGPVYYSELVVSEDSIDNANVLRLTYSLYIFNRDLVWPDAYKTGMSHAEAQDDEVAAWIFSCYFTKSFTGQKVCGNDVPSHIWNDAIGDIRSVYGQDYADGLMYYTEKKWRDLPSEHAESFDKFFRNKLINGQVVLDNGNRIDIDTILKRHGLDITTP